MLKRRQIAAPMALLVAGAVLSAAAAPATGIGGLQRETQWGETAGALLRHFGARATRLPWRLDFGDSYAEIVLRDQQIGGFRIVVYFQMDKRSRGLARIQIERPRHGVNPPAARAALAELEASYGAPDRSCSLGPSRENGYQAAAERLWRRADATIRAIWRDTTLEAAEGCFDLTSGGPCGLEGQLLIRISPPGRDRGACAG